MHGRAAEQPLALAERRLDGVEGDRSDDGERHGGASSLAEPVALLAAPMRAIQIDEFGGPGGARARRGRAGARARPTARCSIRVTPRRHQLRRHARARRTPTCAQGDAAARPRRRGRRACATRRPASAWSRWSAPAATPSTPPRPRRTTFPIPDGVDDGAALALLIQGLTAWHLYRTSAQLRAGRERRRARAPPAASARSPCSSASPLGAGRVIATASSEDKRALALELGADAAVDVTPRGPHRARCSRPTTASGRRRLRDGRRRACSTPSLDALAPFGRLVAYGIASREPNEVATGALMRQLARGRRLLARCTASAPARWSTSRSPTCSRAPRAASCGSSRARPTRSPRRRRAHDDLQARRTTGKLLLDPAPLSVLTQLADMTDLRRPRPVRAHPRRARATSATSRRARSRSRRSRAARRAAT